jgi:hypothetical protein
MLKVIQRFGKHCSCHLHMVTKTSCVTSSPHHVPLKTFSITSFPQPRDHLLLDSNQLFRFTNQHYEIHLSAYSPPCIRMSEKSNHYIFALKVATVMFAETLDNFSIRRGSSPEAEVHCSHFDEFSLCVANLSYAPIKYLKYKFDASKNPPVDRWRKLLDENLQNLYHSRN